MSIWKRWIEFGKTNLTAAKNLIDEIEYLLNYSNQEKKNNNCNSFQENIKNYLTNATTWFMQLIRKQTLFLGFESGVLLAWSHEGDEIGVIVTSFLMYFTLLHYNN